MTDHDCPHAVTLRNLLDACERGRPLSDITDRLRVEVGRLGEATTQPEPIERRDALDWANREIACYQAHADEGKTLALSPASCAQQAAWLRSLIRASGAGTAPQVPTEVEWEGVTEPLAQYADDDVLIGLSRLTLDLTVPPGTRVRVVAADEADR